MIYSKKANFPYPILMNNSNDYKKSEFEFDVDFKENTDNFSLDVEYKISSLFLEKMIKNEHARMILIIKSKDNQFHVIRDINHPKVIIKKSRLCVNTRTVMQLMIQAITDINFASNNDLDDFYDETKVDITVKKGMALGFSNLVIFDGSQKNPYDLFEKKIDSSIPSDIEIRLGTETIMIVYQKEELQFTDHRKSSQLNYPYLYIGLQKAIIAFISHYNKNSEDGNLEEGIRLEDIGERINALDDKLYQLMDAKGITELNLDNIDNTIYLISDQLIKRYVSVIRGLYNGN